MRHGGRECWNEQVWDSSRIKSIQAGHTVIQIPMYFLLMVQSLSMISLPISRSDGCPPICKLLIYEVFISLGIQFINANLHLLFLSRFIEKCGFYFVLFFLNHGRQSLLYPTLKQKSHPGSFFFFFILFLSFFFMGVTLVSKI